MFSRRGLAAEMVPRLLIRADASFELGIGHVMRCLALAQAWRDLGGDAWFVSSSIPETVREHLRTEGLEVLPAGEIGGTASLVAQAVSMRVGHIVLDGRQFDSDWQREIKEAGLRLMVVDDYGQAAPYYADCVLNPDPVSQVMYAKRAPYTRLLLGSKYALLRREFTRSGPRARKAGEGSSRVLITMGGTDPQDMTLTVMRAIGRLQRPALRLRVILSSSNPRRDFLRDLADDLPGSVEVLTDVSDMPKHMRWADVAITAAGVTLWELLYAGTAVICWPRYPADVPILASLGKKGAVLALQPEASPDSIATLLNAALANKELRKRMRAKGRNMIDGEGARRAVKIFSGLRAGTNKESLRH